MEVRVFINRDAISGSPVTLVLNGLASAPVYGLSFAAVNYTSFKQGVMTLQYLAGIPAWIIKAVSGSPRQTLPAVANDEAPNLGQVNTLIGTRQPNLGFVPVQQGGGTAQGVSKVYLGWGSSGGGIRLTVDTSDQGFLAPLNAPNFTGGITVAGPSTFYNNLNVNGVLTVGGAA